MRCLPGYAHICGRVWSAWGPGAWGEKAWVRKRVPAATTRREHVEGKGIGVGVGESRR